MGRVAAALCAVLAAGPALAQNGAPRLVVEQPVLDFGTVERGARVEHSFKLRNQGPGPLRIENVKGSCACTAAVMSAPDLPPGGEGYVAVSLDTSRLAGPTTKVVSVYTSDPGRPVVGLTLTGTVAADLVATPSPLYLGRVRRGDAVERAIVVVPGRPGGSATVTAVEHAHPALAVRVEPRPDGPGQRIVVRLAGDVTLGRFSDDLQLRTTSPSEPVLRVPVLWSVEGDVLVVPPQVTFGVARSGAPVEREIFIRGRGSRPLTVWRVAVPDEVTYVLTPVEDGREYRLTLRLREGLRRRKIEGAVEIFTNYPDEERLVVPLYAVIRDELRWG